MRFDELLTEIGEYGIFQKYVFYLTWPPNILAGFYLLNPVILLGIPLHRCAIPGYDNDTYAIQNGDHASLINATIPPSDEDNEAYDPCHVYSPQNQSFDGNTSTMTTCDRWVYDTSIFKNTYVSEFNLVCDKEMLATNIATILYGGMLFGSIASGLLADRYGRKPVMVASMVLMTGASLGMAWPYSYAVLAVLQFILGGTSLASYMTAFIISVEVTGKTKRLWPGIGENFPYIIGLLLYVAIAYAFRDILTIQLVTSLPGVLLIAYWWIMPESPRWLASKGRVQEAESITRKAARWNKTTFPEGAFNNKLTEELKKDNTGVNVTALFSSKKLLIRTLLICFNWMVLSFSYFGLALNTGNLHGDFYLNFFLGCVVEIPAYFFVLATIERLGRKKIYIFTMVVGGVSCVSTLLSIQYAKDIEILTVLLSMVGRLGVSAGFSVAYMHSAELFPTVTRNAGMGVASLSARIGSMVSPYLVSLGTSIGGSFGEALPLLVIGILSLLSAAATVLLPETLNRDMPDTVEDSTHIEATDIKI